MSRDGNDDNLSLRGAGEQQMALVAQLGQSILTMHHIDEVFQWLAYAIVQHFNIQLVQFWTNQIGQTGRLVTQLRTVVRRDPTIPEQIVVNDYVAYVAQRVTSERRSYQPQPVENLFPSYQSALLKRYGLNYCGACFLSKNMLLPPSETMFSSERSPVPLAMTTLLIIRQFPHPDVIPSITMVLEQAIIMAGNRNLLYMHAPRTGHDFTPQPPTQMQTPQPRTDYDFAPHPPAQMQTPLVQQMPQESVFMLEQLIPRRRQDADMLLTENPFASGALISDKKARRLHAAIDGRSSIADLCGAIGMSSKEAYSALQFLLGQQRIELYTPDGRPANVLPPTK